MRTITKLALVAFSLIGLSSVPKAGALVEKFNEYFPEGRWKADLNIPERIVKLGTNFYACPLAHGDQQAQETVTALHSNPDHMAGYADGQPRSPERCQAIFNNHANGWKKGEFDSGFWFGSANEDGTTTPIGIGGVGTSGVPGIGELFFLLFKEQRNIGHESAIGELLSKWTKFMVDVNTNVSGAPLRAVIATVDPDNSYKIDAVRQMGYEPATSEDMKQLEGTFVVPKDSKVGYNGDMTVLDPSRHGTPKAVYFLNLGDAKSTEEAK